MTAPQSLEDIQRQIAQYQLTGSNEIATSLLLHFEPMIKMAVGKIARNRPDLYEDLQQVASMSLVKCLQHYDPSLGIQFQAYAMKSMIGHMKNYLRDKSWYIQVPRRIKEKGLLIQKIIDELTVRLERSPNVDEIAHAMEMSVEETIEVLAGRDNYHYVSLDTPITQEEEGVTLGDLIGSDATDFQNLEKRLDLEQAFSHLKEQERQVLYMAYYEGHSQRDIAERLGVSQMSISRLQKKAKQKLKEVFQQVRPPSENTL